MRLLLPDDPPESPWTGEPVGSTQEWVTDVALLLMEELCTGFVRRARRTPRERYIELEYPAPWPSGPSRFYVTAVPTGVHAGSWLTRVGLSISPARRAIADRRLIAWLQTCENTDRARNLGQAVVSWVPDRPLVARLDTISKTAGAPDAVLSALAEHAIHGAADAGATTVVTAVKHPVLLRRGFRDTGVGTEWTMATNYAPPVLPT